MKVIEKEVAAESILPTLPSDPSILCRRARRFVGTDFPEIFNRPVAKSLVAKLNQAGNAFRVAVWSVIVALGVGNNAELKPGAANNLLAAHS